MVNIRPPCSASVPLSDQDLYPSRVKKLPSVCSQEVTAYFMLASVANCLPARGFLRGPNRPMTGPMLLTSLVTGYGNQAGKLWSTLPIVPVLRTTSALFLDTLRSTWLASDLYQTPTRSKLSLQEYSYLTPISPTLGWMPWRLVETGP